MSEKEKQKITIKADAKFEPITEPGVVEYVPYDMDKYWPNHFLSLDLLAGAMEAGKDLYVIGRFGGFGGCLFMVECDYERAKAQAMKMIDGASVYRLSVENCGYVLPSGEVSK